MKVTKVFALAGLLAVASPALAQKSKVKSADRERENGDFKNAIKDIEDATQNPETKDKANTWLVRGQVYKQIATDTSRNARAMGMNDASVEAAKSFRHALELQPTKDDVKEIQLEYLYLGNALYNEGIAAYKTASEMASPPASDVEGAKPYFEKALNRFQLFNEAYNNMGKYQADMQKVLKGIDVSVDDAKYLAATSAIQIKDKATARKLLQELVDAKYKKANAYIALAQTYEDDKEWDKAIQALDNGYNVVEGDERKNMLIEKLNVYIQEGKPAESVEVGKKALAADPNNIDIMIALANNYDKLADDYGKQGKTADQQQMNKESDAMYQQALAKDPKGFHTNHVVGISYFNKGVAIYNTAVKLQEKSLQESDKMTEQAKAVWKTSIIYLEKAVNAPDKDKAEFREQLKTDYRSLKAMYVQLDDNANAQKYDNLYKAMK